MWYLLLLSTTVWGCAPDCTCQLGFVACQGENITTLPMFDAETMRSTVHLSFENTLLKSLPDLKWWPNLYMLDVRNNPALSCQTVTALQGERPDLDIQSDCYLGTGSFPGVNPFLLSLEIQTTLIMILSLLYAIWKMVKRKIRNTADDSDNISERDHMSQETTPC